MPDPLRLCGADAGLDVLSTVLPHFAPILSELSWLRLARRSRPCSSHFIRPDDEVGDDPVEDRNPPTDNVEYIRAFAVFPAASSFLANC